MKNTYVKWFFIIPVLWWVYLFFTTQIVVVFDAMGYEGVGKVIAYQGWGEFFRTGPQREPLFGTLVALSMRVGDWWGISYYYPLKIIGLIFLLLTMVFSYRLMRMLAISRPWACLAVFYLGVSPVMTNSSMRLWSEFAAYPWVVLAVLGTIKSWEALDTLPDGSRGTHRSIGHGLMVALMFLLIMSVKAVAEGVLLFFLWPFYWRIISNWRSGNFIKARQVAAFCLSVLVLFEGAVCAYKWANYQCNGQFTFTTRGDWALYGNTARRMQPLTLRRLGAAIAFVPGGSLCPSIFGVDDCDFWSARHSDDIITEKKNELSAQGIKDEAASRYYIHNSVKMILSNPLQAAALMLIEAHKMFFWESSIAFVAYPDWLEAILYSPRFINVTKYILGLLSWGGCVFALYYLCFFPRSPCGVDKKERGALLWVLNFIFWYSAMYSLYFILDRYSFPLISLYMVLIAFALQKLIRIFVK